MLIDELYNFIINNNTTIQKDVILKNIPDRLCHHRVRFLYLLIEFMNNRIKNYLEIGVHNGCSLGYVLQTTNKLNCVGIDLFEDTFYNDDLNQKNINKNLQKINKNNHELLLIKGNSSDKKIIKSLENKKFDIIFIDGDHRYEGVKNDFINYYQLLSEKGLMVFDDYNESPSNVGVFKFINELLKVEKKYFIGHYCFIDNEHKISKYKNGIILFFK